MTKKAQPNPAKEGRQSVVAAREDRLKSALKANMAKRKAQTKARAADVAPEQTDK